MQEKFSGGGGWWQNNFSPGPGFWPLVLGPFEPDLGPDLDPSWDLDLDPSWDLDLDLSLTLVKEREIDNLFGFLSKVQKILFPFYINFYFTFEEQVLLRR